MIRITQAALKYKSVTLLIAAGLFVAGLFSWGSLKQELLPDIQFPIVTVISTMNLDPSRRYPAVSSRALSEPPSTPSP